MCFGAMKAVALAGVVVADVADGGVCTSCMYRRTPRQDLM